MKISDFKLAEFFIRGVCKTHACPFVDLEIVFESLPDSIAIKTAFQGGKLTLSPTDKFNKTVFSIVAAYLTNMDQISGIKCDLTNEERAIIINSIAAVVRDLSYSGFEFDPYEHGGKEESVKSYLNRQSFCWTAMRSIICPAFDKPLTNVSIIARKSPYIDGAKYFNKGDITATDDSIFPFVFSNLEIASTPCREAYLLYEIIRAHEMDPRGVIHEIFTKQELWGKFFGLVRIAFKESDPINDFLTTLSILSDEMGSIEKRLLKTTTSKWNSKTGLWSQSQFNQSTWWYLGLIEKLLEPARGSDWSGYYTLKPFTDELWEKVEDEKKKRGLKELPMELLLRVQSDEYKMQPDLIIQGLLADNRVW